MGWFGVPSERAKRSCLFSKLRGTKNQLPPSSIGCCRQMQAIWFIHASTGVKYIATVLERTVMLHENIKYKETCMIHMCNLWPGRLHAVRYLHVWNFELVIFFGFITIPQSFPVCQSYAMAFTYANRESVHQHTVGLCHRASSPVVMTRSFNAFVMQ